MDRLNLTEAYRKADLACAKVQYRLHGSHMYKRETLLPDSDTRLYTREELQRSAPETMDGYWQVPRLVE